MELKSLGAEKSGAEKLGAEKSGLKYHVAYEIKFRHEAHASTFFKTTTAAAEFVVACADDCFGKPAIKREKRDFSYCESP